MQLGSIDESKETQDMLLDLETYRNRRNTDRLKLEVYEIPIDVKQLELTKYHIRI